jgi:hypothetical protein
MQPTTVCEPSPNLKVQAEIDHNCFFVFLPVAEPILSESFVCRVCKGNGMGMATGSTAAHKSVHGTIEKGAVTAMPRRMTRVM